MSRAQLGEGGSVEARAGAVKEDRGPLRESKKARVWGRGWGGWPGGRGGGVSHGWGRGGGETTEVRLSSGQSPEQGACGRDKAGSGGTSCGGHRVTWALQREQSGQGLRWDMPQRQETSQEALRIGSGGGPSPGPDAAPQRPSELEGP